MELINLLILGVVQGLTEFLPVSSSGHLTVAQHLFGFTTPDNATVDVVLHAGTLVAVLIAFREDLGRLITCWFVEPGAFGEAEELEVDDTRYSDEDLAKITRSKEDDESAPPNDPVVATRRLFLLLLAGSLPLLAALPFREQFEALALDENLVWVTGVALLVTAGLNFALDFLGNIKVSDASRMGYGRALLIGIFQIMALVPGLSRSGSTIFAGVLSGISRQQAARYSFLLSAIAIAGASLLKAGDIGALFELNPLVLGAGFVASVASGYLAIIWLLDLLEKRLLRWLGVYLLGLGGLTLWLSLGA